MGSVHILDVAWGVDCTTHHRASLPGLSTTTTHIVAVDRHITVLLSGPLPPTKYSF